MIYFPGLNQFNIEFHFPVIPTSCHKTMSQQLTRDTVTTYNTLALGTTPRDMKSMIALNNITPHDFCTGRGNHKNFDLGYRYYSFKGYKKLSRSDCSRRRNRIPTSERTRIEASFEAVNREDKYHENDKPHTR
jgi:hypothetical protein